VDTISFELFAVLVRNDAAYDNEDIVEPFLADQCHDSWTEGHVRSGKDRKTDDVHVLLKCGRDDLFRCLAETGVYDFKPGIPEGTCDDFGASVMTIQAGLGNEDTYLLFHLKSGFFVDAVDLAHCVAHFTERRIGAHAVQDRGHHADLVSGCLFQRLEGCANPVVIS